MVDCIPLLKNVGQFYNASLSKQSILNKLTLIYAENGRGKTTLSSILRSLSTKDASLIKERYRLGSEHGTHIVVKNNGKNYIFHNDTWNSHIQDIAVFDDFFIAENVYSGVDVASSHKQNLHKLIIGTQGLQLNAALQEHISKVEQHSKSLKEKEDAITTSIRGELTVDKFCMLEPKEDLETAIKQTEQDIEVAKSNDAVQQHPIFQTINWTSVKNEGVWDIIESNWKIFNSFFIFRLAISE